MIKSLSRIIACLSVVALSGFPHSAGATSDSLFSDTAAVRHRHGVVTRTVRGFDRIDRTYIEPQHYTFTAMLQSTFTYDIYTLRSIGDKPQSITFSPDMRVKVGPYLGWKWFFLGWTFDVAHIDIGKLKQEIDLSIYSSQIGLDIFYRRTGSDYKLRYVTTSGSLGTGIPFNGISAGISGIGLYYIFNHGRFSYPAAFSQSTCQRISCGSWMAGAGYTENSLELDHHKLQQLIDEHSDQGIRLDSGLMFNRVRYHDVSLSAGYAYNWVFARNWLFAASLQAALAYKRSVGHLAETGTGGFSFHNVNLDGIGRFGLVYNNTRWYTGMSLIVRTYNYRKPQFRTNNTFGSMNLYVGYNFGLKKKYRQEFIK